MRVKRKIFWNVQEAKKIIIVTIQKMSVSFASVLINVVDLINSEEILEKAIVLIRSKDVWHKV